MLTIESGPGRFAHRRRPQESFVRMTPPRRLPINVNLFRACPMFRHNYGPKTLNFARQNLRKPQQNPSSSTLVNPKKLLGPPGCPAKEVRRRARPFNGPRLCPARRGISRSESDPQAVSYISDAVIPAKLLRLVCDTAAVRARGATPLSCGRRCSRARGPRVRAKAPSPLRFAGAVHDASESRGALWPATGARRWRCSTT